MTFSLATYGLGYLAGVLSTLSPCVLPLLPILIATALSAHRFGPFALAAGLTLSFSALGLFIATLGFTLGLDADRLRQVAALMLLGFGVLLLAPPLQRRLSTALAGIGAGGESLLARFKLDGLGGQFVIGLMLGLIWTPCVGPTLGAAATLAAQGQQLSAIAVLMLLFGIGAGTPLVVFGLLSRPLMLRLRGRLLVAGQQGKYALGAIVLLLGLSILGGWDKQLETWAVTASPQWLTALTTRY
jgi:cytochrome c-type biogenesis protein